MQIRCPSCGAPITDDAKFCHHCGTKLPDNTQKIEIKSEIKIEDTARLEEVRLKYDLEEKKRNDATEIKRNELRVLKTKLWISWILCIVSLCVAITIYNPIPIENSPFSTPLFILSVASGIYAIILSISLFFKTVFRKKYKS